MGGSFTRKPKLPPVEKGEQLAVELFRVDILVHVRPHRPSQYRARVTSDRSGIRRKAEFAVVEIHDRAVERDCLKHRRLVRA